MIAAATSSIIADPFYRRVKALVIERTGMVFYQERDEDFARILSERLATIGLRDCASYLMLLRERDEMDALIADLTIGETYFFRYREQFEALRDIVLPRVIERNAGKKRLRIWSAGCSTGPEPYTVAIILKQRFGQRIDGWDVQIIGTDINQRFLGTAREGLYEDWAFRSTPDAMRNACFVREGKRWRIAPAYRELVRFEYHNLVDDPMPSPAHGLVDIDIILCRNVVIYFTTDAFRQIIAHFHDTLAEDGWLVVGHSELNTELFRAFRTVDAPGAVLYQKTDQPEPQASFDFAGYAARQQPVLPPDPLPPILPTILPLPQDTPTLFTAPLPAAPLPAAPLPAAPLPAANEDLPAEAEADAAPNEDPLAELRRLADQGAWLEAMRLCRKLLDHDPMNAVLHLHHALLLEHMRQIEAAAEALRRALYLDRTLAMAHYHLGRLAADQGNRADAARAFRNAQKLLAGRSGAELAEGSDDMSVAELSEILALHIKSVGE